MAIGDVEFVEFEEAEEIVRNALWTSEGPKRKEVELQPVKLHRRCWKGNIIGPSDERNPLELELGAEI